MWKTIVFWELTVANSFDIRALQRLFMLTRTFHFSQ
jgi:hypothetical protein